MCGDHVSSCGHVVTWCRWHLDRLQEADKFFSHLSLEERELSLFSEQVQSTWHRARGMKHMAWITWHGARHCSPGKGDVLLLLQADGRDAHSDKRKHDTRHPRGHIMVGNVHDFMGCRSSAMIRVLSSQRRSTLWLDSMSGLRLPWGTHTTT